MKSLTQGLGALLGVNLVAVEAHGVGLREPRLQGAPEIREQAGQLRVEP